MNKKKIILVIIALIIMIPITIIWGNKEVEGGSKGSGISTSDGYGLEYINGWYEGDNGGVYTYPSKKIVLDLEGFVNKGEIYIDFYEWDPDKDSGEANAIYSVSFTAPGKIDVSKKLKVTKNGFEIKYRIKEDSEIDFNYMVKQYTTNFKKFKRNY